MSTKRPEVVLSVIEELLQRNALDIALANKGKEELQQILDFIIWKIIDKRYANILIEVSKIIIGKCAQFKSPDMYACTLGICKEIDEKFRQLYKAIADEANVLRDMQKAKGQLVREFKYNVTGNANKSSCYVGSYRFANKLFTKAM